MQSPMMKMVVRQRKRCDIKVEVKCGEALHMRIQPRHKSMFFIICEYANQREVLTLRIFSIGLSVWADCSILRLACDMSKVL
jgi:hypothetical protein